MGQASSNMVKKVGTWSSQWWTGTGSNQGQSSELVVSPFVYKRRSSLYMDEDGDQAHEFYEERVDKKSRHRYMKRLKHNLRPVGDVDLPFPRIHCDIPIVLCEAPVVR